MSSEELNGLLEVARRGLSMTKQYGTNLIYNDDLAELRWLGGSLFLVGYVSLPLSL